MPSRQKTLRRYRTSSTSQARGTEWANHRAVQRIGNRFHALVAGVTVDTDCVGCAAVVIGVGRLTVGPVRRVLPEAALVHKNAARRRSDLLHDGISVGSAQRQLRTKMAGLPSFLNRVTSFQKCS